jgi:hypothetical protein
MDPRSISASNSIPLLKKLRYVSWFRACGYFTIWSLCCVIVMTSFCAGYCWTISWLWIWGPWHTNRS